LFPPYVPPINNSMKTRTDWKTLDELQTLVRELGIASRAQYETWWRATKPPLCPGTPYKVYKDQWPGWGPFLGTRKKGTSFRSPRSPDGQKVLQAQALAKLRGDKTYTVDVPCTKGHLVERRTDSNACGECQRQYSKEYNRRNPERVFNNVKRWQQQEGRERTVQTSRRRYVVVRADPVLWAKHLADCRNRYRKRAERAKREAQQVSA